MKKIILIIFAIMALNCFLPLCSTDRENMLIDVTKPLQPTEPGLNSRESLLSLLPKNSTVIEIGAETGDFSMRILQITNPKQLYLIDCWQEQDQSIYPEERSQNLQNSYFNLITQRFSHETRVTIIKGFSHELAAQFPDDYFDWIYIDANHAYDAVKLDLETWLPKVKNGGFIAGHDYFINGYFGVVQAVNEFLVKYNFSMTYLTNESIPSYAIKIIR